jgi:hypothetical protein
VRPPLAVLLAVVLVSAGCLGPLGSSRPPSDQRAVDALDRTDRALETVTSYRVRTDGTATLSAGDREETQTLTARTRVNVTAREANSTGRQSDPFLQGTGERRAYVSGYTAYTECRLHGWGRRNLSASRPWTAYTPVGSQLAVFDRAPVYWRGTQRLDGREAAVVRATPTREELAAAPGLWSISVDPDDAVLRNATLTLWLDTETWRPRQLRHESVWRNGGEVRLTATVQFDGYDEPTTVARPSFTQEEIRPGGC